MQDNKPNLDTNYRFFSFSKYTIILLTIIGISSIIRFYYFPIQVPLTADALYYFWYSSDIYQIGELPNNWTPANNGWPIFVSAFFTVFDSKDVFTLMQIQRSLSVLMSILLIIPVYFLCKKFVARKFAVIGASLVAFDPRLMINSFLGVTDPLYFLLISTGLVLFLSSNKKLVLCSFIPVSLAVVTRGEGIFFLIALFVLFFIKYRKEKYKVFFNYLIILTIVSLIIIPITNYRIDVIGNDPIFLRSINSADEALVKVTGTGQTDWFTDNVNKRIFDGLKTLTQFLIWVMIPNFIIFLPLGIFLIFQNRNFEKNTIIISSGILMIPAFYAYTFPAHPALDTRYLYVLFPMFAVLASLSIERIVRKLNRSNAIIIIIISAIIVTSVLFYDYKKIDYEHEKESFEIMERVSTMINGTNILYPETNYLTSIQTMNQWPNLYSEIQFNILIIPYGNDNSLQNFILNSKDKGLTHIMIDDNKKRPDFLKELFIEEEKYTYLKKIYDSKNNGFEYQVKVFEINYELFNSLKDNMVLIQK